MIYLELFLTFFKIGAVSFGGGYAMISLIRETVLKNGWLGEEELLNMIAVSESTPGPIAVNMATFVGSAEGGALGALFATLAVVLPSFIIILIIAAFIRSFLRYRYVKAFLGGVRPCIIALILSTAAVFFLGNILGIKEIGSYAGVDLRGAAVLFAIAVIGAVTKKLQKRKPSPIVLILISALLGMLLYSF